VKEDVLAVAIGGTENLAGGVVRRVEGAGHLVSLHSTLLSLIRRGSNGVEGTSGQSSRCSKGDVRVLEVADNECH